MKVATHMPKGKAWVLLSLSTVWMATRGPPNMATTTTLPPRPNRFAAVAGYTQKICLDKEQQIFWAPKFLLLLFWGGGKKRERERERERPHKVPRFRK